MGETYQSIVINAAAGEVWNSIRDFHDLSWAPNVITGVEVVGDAAGDEIGAGRVLNGVFKETLRTVDDDARVFTYSIDEGPGPLAEGVRNYLGKVSVQPTDDGGTVVEWTSSWEENDEAVHEFCHPIYLALLDDMKQSLE